MNIKEKDTRYAGDEFVIIIRLQKDESIHHFIDDIKNLSFYISTFTSLYHIYLLILQFHENFQ